MFRLGVVSFLNARPLIDGLEAAAVELVFDVPAALPSRLDAGEVDAALIPIVDVLRGSGRYRVISDACIGCDGETMTVRVFSQVPPDRLRTLRVDPDSHTSVALARILWRELYQRDLTVRAFESGAESIDQLEAVLLIGDKVLNPQRGSFAYEVDLGGAWRQHTGLPFVFAVWACRDDGIAGKEPSVGDVAAGPRTGRRARQRDAGVLRPVRGPAATFPGESAVGCGEDMAQLAGLLSEARDRGVARAGQIAETCGPALGWPVELARRYLTRCLKYKLDARSVQGANLFARLCADAGLVPSDGEVIWPRPLLAHQAGTTP